MLKPTMLLNNKIETKKYPNLKQTSYKQNDQTFCGINIFVTNPHIKWLPNLSSRSSSSCLQSKGLNMIPGVGLLD